MTKHKSRKLRASNLRHLQNRKAWDSNLTLLNVPREAMKGEAFSELQHTSLAERNTTTNHLRHCSAGLWIFFLMTKREQHLMFYKKKKFWEHSNSHCHSSSVCEAEGSCFGENWLKIDNIQQTIFHPNVNRKEWWESLDAKYPTLVI